VKDKIFKSILKLDHWLEKNNYKAYDPFDGLDSKLLRPLTLNNKFLRIALQQGIRRFPINLRPFVGIEKNHSSKGMGFIARAYIRLNKASGKEEYAQKAKFCLDWLIDNQSQGYSGACWGNHFDYQSRVFYLPKGVPTIVWVSLIGYAFLDAYEHFNDTKYLKIAESACEHISKDLARYQDGEDICISYIPIDNKQVHNANTLGASFLARIYKHNGNEKYYELAEKAINYTVKCQRENHSWYYGEASNLHWVDNFHTAYVLDSIKYYITATGDGRHQEKMEKGFGYWKDSFFLDDGTPKYYDFKTFPLDIQCASQAIDTLVFFSDYDPAALELAKKVANWTIDNMQDGSGYYYFRKYNKWLVNKTPTLHWGQATMFCALSGLYQRLTGFQDNV
jgi:rhamnogalacturonyl hydrolase YesR